VFGQTGKISGTVTDGETGDPMPGANVIVEETELGSATDENGNYFIINIPPGTYAVTASMIGYQTITKTEVRISVDHTTPLNFQLSTEAIAGEEVVVEAEREVIVMDRSASEINATADEVVEMATVTSVEDFINYQAGVEGMEIRGGGLDQTGFMMNGLMVVDNRANQPVMSVNLSAIQEINIIKGGFSAEYGNVRSGLVNVVTKEGSPTRYSGTLNLRMTPPHLKHRGASMFDPDNYYLRPYLDPDVMWEGTDNWDQEIQEQNIEFVGWDQYSQDLLSDDDPTNDRSAEECMDLFLWRHRAEGSSELGQTEGQYGHLPDWEVDASIGGPVPFVSRYLKRLSFFASYKDDWEMFALPTSRDYYRENNAHLKLTSPISSNMKLSVEGVYGEINSVNRNRHGGARDNNYVSSARDIFWSEVLGSSAHKVAYWPTALNPFNVYRSMQGIAFDHVLSEKTFYNLRVSHVHIQNSCHEWGPEAYRDTTTIKYFGNTPVDEIPYGFWIGDGQPISGQDGCSFSAEGGGGRDYGEVSTFNVKFDLTSQLNLYHQLKFGFTLNYDDLYTHYEKIRYESPWEDLLIEWQHYPYRVGAYFKDKMEFEGLIADIGVRLDYNNPNCEWYTEDRYSKYFKARYIEEFTEVAPTEPVSGHIKVSPRVGISHPISANAKLYFNYGHFYSMPQSDDMYEIHYGRKSDGIRFLGNPSANLPRTVAYEFGLEWDIANQVLCHISGYYKDVTEQTGTVYYTNYMGDVDYGTIENNNFEDIRGFEIRIDKRWGKWITGWLNYNYMVQTSGYVGREHYYEDPRLQRIQGLQNPYLERPLARPYARANVRIMSPTGWGPTILNRKLFSEIYLNLLGSYKAGNYETWDPLETYELKNNLHWKGRYNFDLRAGKWITIGNQNLNIFVDIQNVFNIKHMYNEGFVDSQDRRRYLQSLHLPLYEGEKYQAEGYTPGNDRPGDIKSEDKPYIDMPNRGFLTFLNPRVFTFGLKWEF